MAHYKHDYDTILTRLVNILKRLNNGEKLSVKELANEFNVSTKTVQRDFNERLITFPIERVGKKWQMQENALLDTSLSIEDTLVLDIIEKLAQGVGDSFFDRTKKLMSNLKIKDFNPIYTRLDMEDIADNIQEMQILEQSIRQKNIITFEYLSGKRKYKSKAKPLKIANYEGFWYLIALDASTDKLRKYHFKSIQNIKTQKQTFEHTTRIDELLDKSVSIWFQEDNQPFYIKLFISHEIAKYFIRKPITKHQVIEQKYKDGSIDISLFITYKMEILPIVKYWLPHIRILEPAHLNDELMKDVQKYINA